VADNLHQFSAVHASGAAKLIGLTQMAAGHYFSPAISDQLPSQLPILKKSHLKHHGGTGIPDKPDGIQLPHFA
jgi:hypothetical protein